MINEEIADDVNVLDTAPLQKETVVFLEKQPVSYLKTVNPDATDPTIKYALPNTIVELRPLDKVKWHGQTGNLDFDKGISVECLVHKGKFMTGLTQDEQKVLEALTGYNLNPTFNLNIQHPFYQGLIGKLKLLNQLIMLDLSNPIDYIKFKFATQHSHIASSEEEGLSNEKPLATHYIYSEENANTLELNKAAVIKKASKIFESFNIKQLRNLYNVLFESDARMLTDDVVEAKILLFKEQNLTKFIDVAELDKTVLQARSVVIAAVSRNVIQFTGTSYLFDGVTLGYNIEEAARTILAPEHQELKMRIINQCANK